MGLLHKIAAKRDAMDTAQDFYGKIVNSIVCVTSIFSSKNAGVLMKSLVPFRGISLVASTIFNAIAIKDNVQDARKAEGKYKAIPSFKVLNAIGEIFDSTSTAISFVRSTHALSVASTVFGVAAVGLQIFGCAVDSMQIHSLRKQGKTFRALKADDPRAALKSVRNKKGSLSFFRLLNHKQSVAVQKIYRSEDDQQISRAKDLVDRRITVSKRQYAIKLALTILSTIGIILLMTLPTPAAPILWGLLGIGTFAAIGVGIYSFVTKRKFTKTLEGMIPQAA